MITKRSTRTADRQSKTKSPGHILKTSDITITTRITKTKITNNFYRILQNDGSSEDSDPESHVKRRHSTIYTGHIYIQIASHIFLDYVKTEPIQKQVEYLTKIKF